MAADHLKVKRHERSDRQKHMELNFACALGGPESTMKFSPQRLESPPPKPPRRRYSDQLIVSSLGAYPSIKKSDGNPRNDSKPKRCIPKPTYLSLPANLTSDVLTECNDTSNICSHPLSVSVQPKHSKENEYYSKKFLEDFKVSESAMKQSHTNRLSSIEKLPSVIPEANSDHVFSNYQCDNVTPYAVDKLSRNSINSSKIFMTNTYINQNLKSLHKECHRRHHSDPAISHYNLQNDNSIKFSYEQCCDNISYSSNKVNKCFHSADSCCKKNHFIMQEKRILKEINDKLWHHVCSLQTCLENTRKKVFEENADVSVSDLLSSIYYAQKAKDSAMEERLKLVHEERDAVLHELQDLIHILSKRFGYTVGEKEDKDIKELLGELECVTNPLKFLKYQRMLLSQIHNIKETKQGHPSHKLRQAVIERDNALEKVKTLEEEVKEMKLCYDLWHSDNKHWEFTVFDIISQVMHQRDTLFSKVDNGFDISNVVYRPLAVNKLDSIEHQSVLPHESRSKATESLKNHQSMHLSDKQQHSMSSSEDIMELKEEILLLNKTLEGERKKREQTEEKCFRLERLIHILRKKLNGQNIGVPV